MRMTTLKLLCGLPSVHRFVDILTNHSVEIYTPLPENRLRHSLFMRYTSGVCSRHDWPLLTSIILYITHTALLWHNDGKCNIPDSNSKCVGWARRICTFVVLLQNACVSDNCNWQMFQAKFDNQLYGCMWQLLWTNLTVDVDHFDNYFRQIWQWFFLYVSV